MAEVRAVAIIGGGQMGAGIAQVFLSAGHRVNIFEPQAAVRNGIRERVAADLKLFGRDAALLGALSITDNLHDAVRATDYVTEAAPEKLAVKRAIFKDLIEAVPSTAILASNTSVLPIHRIADGLPSAERIIGTHWWNPPGLIPLVEVVQSHATSDATVRTTMELLTSIGKAPAHVTKDVPGFVANRLQHALWREAIAMVAEGVCDAATLDACVKNSFGLRLSVLGPLENADLVGLDLTLDIHHTIIPELNRSALPHPFLEQQVAAGNLGFKTGKGFREWTPAAIKLLRDQLASHLLEAQRQREQR